MLSPFLFLVAIIPIHLPCLHLHPNNNMGFRIGFGVDYHQLAEGREFIIGGIHVPHPQGAVGHSDADVLLHAICDAILGAACLGDIGTHFPDNDQQYKNIDSKILLQKTASLMKKEGFKIVNIDTTVCLQDPKLKDHISVMRDTIASILDIQKNAVSVKATTTEKMGFVGRKEGVVAYATVLLEAL
jgi:2-C-methyl-D-erythritol 2,4-cyclodiphosphate synthase